MKILLTGAGGQVGWEIQRQASHNKSLQLLALVKDQLDISDARQVEAAIAHYKPQLIINAAAYTAVDKAESDAQRAMRINADGVTYLANACRAAGIPMVHLSTDYVFDGNAIHAYAEDDTCNPLSVYGNTKLQGEFALREHLPQHIILRTSWVFGVHGHNFVKTVLRLAQERETLNIVDDQQGCPTCARDIAETVLSISEKILRSPSPETAWGTYHYCGAPAVSWYEFALAVVECARDIRSLTVKAVLPISTDAYPTAATRPKHSVLNCEKISRAFAIQRCDWKARLRETVKAVLVD